MSEKRARILFFAMVAISHLLLPFALKSRNWFLFSSWQMYSNVPQVGVRDISWDGGQTFLLRDYRGAFAPQTRVISLYYFLQNDDFESVKKHFGVSIRRVCQCSDFEVFKLQLYPKEFFLEKKSGPVSLRTRL